MLLLAVSVSWRCEAQYVLCLLLCSLQVVLCFSPVGDTLRVRCRNFPAVVNCTSIDWFHEWPEEALVSVSHRFLEDVELLTVRGVWCCSSYGPYSITFCISLHVRCSYSTHIFICSALCVCVCVCVMQCVLTRPLSCPLSNPSPMCVSQ